MIIYNINTYIVKVNYFLIPIFSGLLKPKIGRLYLRVGIWI